MLRHLIRISLALLTVFAVIFSDAYLKARESVFPLGASHSISVSVEHSPLSREQILAGLNRIVTPDGSASPTAAQWLAKSVPDPQDFTHGRSLYRFGPDENAAIPNGPAPWYDSSFHGDIRPAAELGTASLNGVYVGRLDGNALSQLTAWMTESQIEFSVAHADPAKLLFQTVVTNGFGTALAAAFLVMLMCAVSWSVHRAPSQIFRLAGGTPPARILAQDLLALARLAVLPVGGAAVLGLGVVVLLRGGQALALLLPFALPALAGTALATALAVLLISYGGRPRLSVFARRVPPVMGHAPLGTALKVAALLLTAFSLPAVSNSVLIASGAADRASHWAVMGEAVGLRMTAIATEEEFQAAQKPLADLIREQDSAGRVLLASEIPVTSLPRDALGSYDAAFIVNQRYLDRVSRLTGARYTETSPDAAEQAMGAGSWKSLQETLALWVAHPASGAAAPKGLRYMSLAPESPAGAVTPAVQANETLALAQRPLLIVADDVMAAFRPTFTGALLTQKAIAFTDPGRLQSSIEKLGLQPKVLSIDRISDEGLARSQEASYLAVTRGIALALILTALVAGTLISAWIHCLLDRERIFPRRIAGNPWHRVLRRRFTGETALSAGSAVLAFGALTAVGAPLSGAAFGVVGLFLALTIPAHILAARQTVVQTLTRKA